MEANSNNSNTQHLPSRSDGEQSRARIVYIALKLFAEQGFAKTSIRQIAKEAEVNVSAISYYFGDKAGLYKVVFTEPLGTPQNGIQALEHEHLSLEEMLSVFYKGFVEPLKQGELVQLCTRLHMREMVEPNGLWEEEVENNIAPQHQALRLILQRHLKADEIDEDIQRLTMAVVALGVYLYVGRDVTNKTAAALTATNEALDLICERFTMYASAMVAAEAVRRANA